MGLGSGRTPAPLRVAGVLLALAAAVAVGVSLRGAVLRLGGEPPGTAAVVGATPPAAGEPARTPGRAAMGEPPRPGRAGDQGAPARAADASSVSAVAGGASSYPPTGEGTAPDVWEPHPDELRPLLRSSLAEALADEWPERRFGPAELDAMTDLLLAMRAARLALTSLPYTAAAAAERARQQAALGDAAARFAEIAGVGPHDLTERLQPGVGLTRPGSENEAPVLETLPPLP